MSELQDQLIKLDAIKNTNLSNLNLPSPTGDNTGLIRLSGVTRNSDGELIYVDEDGTETRIATVDATTGFSRFVFDVAGQFSLVADSYKDTLNIIGQTGILITTDPSTDTMIISADPSTLIPSVGTGNSVINSSGAMRTFVAGDNLGITTTEQEIIFSVSLGSVEIGTGINVYGGLNATGQPQLRSLGDSPTATWSLDADGETLLMTAIPNLIPFGSLGVTMVVMDNGVGKIRNITNGTNIRINTEIDGELMIQSLQTFSHKGAGTRLVTQGANDVLDFTTVTGGGGTTIYEDADGTLRFESETRLENLGTGAPLTYVDNGIGKVRSIKAGFGMEVTQNANEVELKSNVRATSLGDGAELGTVTTGGLLELKTIKAEDSTVVVSEDNGAITLKANHDAYIVNGRLDDALDGSGDPYHLIITTDGGLDIDCGPIPYLHADYDNSAQKILVYNRQALVGQIPDGNPDFGWPSSLDFELPANSIEFIDLETS